MRGHSLRDSTRMSCSAASGAKLMGCRGNVGAGQVHGQQAWPD